MESSFKERLTGALIFVAAVVVIVPEMLSGPEPQPLGVPPASDPADGGAPLRTYSVQLNDVAGARAEVPPPPVSEAPAAEQSPAQLPPASPPVEAAAADSPSALAPATPDAVASSAGGNWWLRVGIFGVRDNAERLVQKLRAAGFAVDVDKQTVGGKDMYRVRAGPVRDRAEALALQVRLKASGNDSLLLPP